MRAVLAQKLEAVTTRLSAIVPLMGAAGQGGGTSTGSKPRSSANPCACLRCIQAKITDLSIGVWHPDGIRPTPPPCPYDICKLVNICRSASETVIRQL